MLVLGVDERRDDSRRDPDGAAEEGEQDRLAEELSADLAFGRSERISARIRMYGYAYGR